jgi:hypothetical protein
VQVSDQLLTIAELAAWLHISRAHVSGSGPKEHNLLSTYGGETVPGERVPYRANLIANHAQERAEMIGRIIRSIAGQEPD